MVLPTDPLALVLLAVSLVGLVCVVGGCVGLIVAHRRRARAAWGRGKRTLVGIGSLLTSLTVLILPPGASWVVYRRAVDRIDEALAMDPSPEKVRLLAHAIDSAWSVACAAGLADLVLLVPCAVLVGLALSVPFFLRDRGEDGE
jgi:hypothetical protein